MKQFFAKLWLWWHNYCPKHAVAKKASFLHGGYLYCEACRKEKKLAFENKVQRMKERANGIH